MKVNLILSICYVAVMELFLIGAGHAHLNIAKRAKEFIQKGTNVTLVSPDKFWYSGLATGMLGGQYEPKEDQVDPKRLIEREGGRFIQDYMVGLDPQEKKVILGSGDHLNYDAVSLNIGSESDELPYAYSVKPISNLWKLRQHLEKELISGNPRVIVVGGGASGCEVAANIEALSRLFGKKLEITLISKDKRLMKEHSQSVSRLMEKVLTGRGVNLLLSTSVERVEKGAVIVNGQKHEADFIVMATGLKAPRILHQIGFGEDGMRVNAFLQSLLFPEIFGSGDCISIEGHNLPKLGVYSVRESEVLFHNLMAYLTGNRMREYIPQSKCLSIINLGDRTALAVRPPFYWHGRLSFWLKDQIDRAFLRRFN